MTAPGHRLRDAGTALALIRAAAIPVFFAAERLVDHPVANSAPFGPLLAVAALYAATTLALAVRGRSLAPPPVLAAADLVLVALLVATSGGPFSQLRYAFFLLPIGAALLLRPARTAAASAVAVAFYALIAATYPGADDADAVGFEVAQGLFLVWMGTAATVLSALLARRASDVAELAASRRQLVAQALDAEDRARRRLAEALHDDALQSLLAARQMLGTGDAELVAQGLDDAVRQIREAVFDLHPHLLAHAGLRAALEAVVERLAARGGPRGTVEVDAGAAGVQDELVFALARELLANVARHAAAEHVSVRVERVAARGLRLDVVDDGVGVDPDAVRAAPLRGHIGLASCRERVAAHGGRLEVTAGPGGRGTRVIAELPSADAAR